MDEPNYFDETSPEGEWRPRLHPRALEFFRKIENQLFPRNDTARRWQEREDDLPSGSKARILFHTFNNTDFSWFDMKSPEAGLTVGNFEHITLAPQGAKDCIEDYLSYRFGISREELQTFFVVTLNKNQIVVETAHHEARRIQVANIINDTWGNGVEYFYEHLVKANKVEAFKVVERSFQIDRTGQELDTAPQDLPDTTPALEPDYKKEKTKVDIDHEEETFKAYLRLGMLRGILKRFSASGKVDSSLRSFEIDLAEISGPNALLNEHIDAIRPKFNDMAKLKESLEKIVEGIGVHDMGLTLEFTGSKQTAQIQINNGEDSGGGRGITHRVVKQLVQDYCSQPYIHMLKSADKMSADKKDASISHEEFRDLLEIGGLTRMDLFLMIKNCMDHQKYETVGLIIDYMNDRRDYIVGATEIVSSMLSLPGRISDMKRYPSMNRLSFAVSSFLTDAAELTEEKRRSTEEKFGDFLKARPVIKELYGINDEKIASGAIQYGWYNPGGFNAKWDMRSRVYIRPEGEKDLTSIMPAIKAMIKATLFEMASDPVMFRRIIGNSEDKFSGLLEVAGIDDKELDILLDLARKPGLSERLHAASRTRDITRQYPDIGSAVNDLTSSSSNQLMVGMINMRRSKGFF